MRGRIMIPGKLRGHLEMTLARVGRRLEGNLNQGPRTQDFWPKDTKTANVKDSSFISVRWHGLGTVVDTSTLAMLIKDFIVIDESMFSGVSASVSLSHTHTHTHTHTHRHTLGPSKAPQYFSFSFLIFLSLFGKYTSQKVQWKTCTVLNVGQDLPPELAQYF